MDKKKIKNSPDLEFDQDSIRRFIGLIALLLPVAVGIAAWQIPDSISGSYHEQADFPFLPYFPAPRDIFVGSLFVIGAFLMNYKGQEHKQVGKFWKWLARFWPGALNWGDRWRRRQEDIISTIGGLSAWVVALFPTEYIDPETVCPNPIIPFAFAPAPSPAQVTDFVSTIHLVFAAIVFLTTVYFCLGAFRVRLIGKINDRGPAGPWYRDPLKWRMTLYYISGIGILMTIVLLGLLAIFDRQGRGICVIYAQTYWAEVLMLVLFAVAWLTASKPPFLQDPSDKARSSRSIRR
jgi:hypothetical protein